MEAPPATALRLIAALEELVVEETTLIRMMDFTETIALRERAAPIVARLCELAADPAVAELGPRIDGVLDRSSQNYHFLEAQLSRLQAELERLNDARARLRQVAPVYRPSRPAAGEPRLNTAA